MSFEWLNPARAQFSRLSARLPHAIMIQGEPGIGKSSLAMEIVASLLCDSPIQTQTSQQACGQCSNCILFAAGNHPDFHYLASEQYVAISDSAHLSYTERYLEEESKRKKRKPRKIISVEQIRSLIHDFSLSNHSAERKIALIQPAEAMNTSAANALLKLLEEPNPGSVLLLVCSEPSQLPMTIRSRCISITSNPPAPEDAMAWLLAQQMDDITARKALAISGGAPLIALACHQAEEIAQFENVLEVLSKVLHEGLDPVTARESVIRLQPPKVILAWLQMVMAWLIQQSAQVTMLSAADYWRVYETELGHIVQYSGESNASLFQLYDDLVQLKQQDIEIINLSLALDKWLIAFAQRLKQKKA